MRTLIAASPLILLVLVSLYVLHTDAKRHNDEVATKHYYLRIAQRIIDDEDRRAYLKQLGYERNLRLARRFMAWAKQEGLN